MTGRHPERSGRPVARITASARFAAATAGGSPAVSATPSIMQASVTTSSTATVSMPDSKRAGRAQLAARASPCDRRRQCAAPRATGSAVGGPHGPSGWSLSPVGITVANARAVAS